MKPRRILKFLAAALFTAGIVHAIHAAETPEWSVVGSGRMELVALRGEQVAFRIVPKFWGQG